MVHLCNRVCSLNLQELLTQPMVHKHSRYSCIWKHNNNVTPARPMMDQLHHSSYHLMHNNSANQLPTPALHTFCTVVI
jgi:hypothetical protein